MLRWYAVTHDAASDWTAFPGNVRIGLRMVADDIARTLRRIKPPR